MDTQIVVSQRRCRSLAFSALPVNHNRPQFRYMAWKKNPVQVALKLHAKMEMLPKQTHGELARHVGLSRGRICQYLGLLKLPREVVNYMADSRNKHVVDHITEQALQDLLKLPKRQILFTFRRLVEKKGSD